MTTQSMIDTSRTPGSASELAPSLHPLWKIGLAILFLALGLAVLLFGSIYYNRFPTSGNLLYSGGLCIAFLTASIIFKRNDRLFKYWQIAYAFFVASAVNVVFTLLAGYRDPLLFSLGILTGSNLYLALDKVYEVLIVVIPILILTRIAGLDLGSIFFQKGKLKLGLGFGLLVFFNFVTSVLMFYAGSYSSPVKLGNALLWGFVFSLCNSMLEEIWFRAIFLKPMVSLIGVAGSVAVTSVWFAMIHLLSGSTFMPALAIPVFIINTLTLGIACGTLMVKSKSIWGPVIIHAAADIFLFVSLLAFH